MSLHVTSNVELRNYVRLLLNVELRNNTYLRNITSDYYLVRWLKTKMVTRWIKAPHFAHVFFRCLSDILEGGARATTPWSG